MHSTHNYDSFLFREMPFIASRGEAGAWLHVPYPSVLGFLSALVHVLFLFCTLQGEWKEGYYLPSFPAWLGYLSVVLHLFLAAYLLYRMRGLRGAGVGLRVLWALSAFFGSVPVARQCLRAINRRH